MEISKTPPKTNEGCWSSDVAVITNMGNILESAYFGKVEEDGV